MDAISEILADHIQHDSELAERIAGLLEGLTSAGAQQDAIDDLISLAWRLRHDLGEDYRTTDVTWDGRAV